MFIILVSKDEAATIRQKFPDVCITQTMRQHSKSNRGKNYVPEYRKVIDYVFQLRNSKKYLKNKGDFINDS